MISLDLLSGFYPPTDAQVQQCLLLAVGLITVSLVHAAWNKYNRKQPPVINPTNMLDFTGGSTKVDFLQRSYEMIYDTSKPNYDRPYTVNSDVGPMVVLPPRFADEIKNNPQLSFLKAMDDAFHGSTRGFETFKADAAVGILARVAKKQLTKYLNKITEPLSNEAAFSLQTLLGDSSEWKDFGLTDVTLSLVARLSSRVFLGDKLCRDPAWLRITTEYPVNGFNAAYVLRLYPKILRPIVHWFLPECKLLRRQYAEACSIIQPVIDQRMEEKRKALESGLPAPTYDDAIDWAQEESKQTQWDPATFQLSMAVAAVHTTTDLISQTIVELLNHPEYIQPLRDEVIEVLRIHGWTKTALYNLKLMDSILKETQRVKPISMISMQRIADADIRLSDGTVIPKGGQCAVANTTRLNGGSYEEPDKFDGYRFLKMRSDPGKEHLAQFVTTGVDSLGFGHGTHACPGRFFAANEVKVALCHLLLKYDVELGQGAVSDATWYGFALNVNKDARIRVRRRKEEIDIDHLSMV
ncbi:cytochrome P450 [Xylaria cf. heliscus]|nr:cytochrome P450 [Xylaria cf. heliscus]